MKRYSTSCALSLLLTIVFALSAFAQITPSDDSYTLTSSPTANFGAATTLNVQSAGATTFVRFDLSGIPPTVTGAMVAKATLKIYVGTVTTAGSFNVDLVTSSWKENTITANDSPTLGSAIASAVPVIAADKNKYVLIDVTTAAVDWLNGTANDGLAIVPDGAVSFALNSKETTTTSHPAELDIVLTGPAGPPGPISGVTAGAGLTGGGTKGNVKLSLLTTCTSGQVLQWNGSTWVCATSKGKGTITGVTAGTDLTGGGTSGNVTLNLDTSKVPQLNASNSFTGNQSVTGNLTSTATITGAAGIFGAGTITSDSALTIAGGPSAIYAVSVQDDTILAYSTADGTFAIFGSAMGGNSAAGVTGEVEGAGGFGVQAINGSTAGQALWAETFALSSANGAGPDAVHGVSHGPSGAGVAGVNDASGGIGVYGRQLISGSYAGRFDGDVWVNGNLSKNGGSFKIDHPLDPSNKYLYHSFVESPDMKNIYDGVAILDASGEAVVTMPEWFGALNRDFRYQLTCIGGFAPVYIADEMANNQFKVGGGKPGMKVSWQVTGTRQDAWANAHRIPVEEIKPEDEHGTYLHPELFGAPETSAVGWGRYRFPDNAGKRGPRMPSRKNRGHLKPEQTEATGSLPQ
jgi:hypothetical protein